MLSMGCGSTQEEYFPLIPMDKVEYAYALDFNVRIVIDGEVLNTWPSLALSHIGVDNRRESSDRLYHKLVFVHSEVEAATFPDTVVVAWPRGEFTLGAIDGIHLVLALDESDFGRWRDAVTLEDVGLTCPITVEDLVDNWEQVNSLLRRFTGGEHETIRFMATERARRTAWQEERNLLPRDKLSYARSMRFEFRIMVDGEARSSWHDVIRRTLYYRDFPEKFDPFYDELVFVYSEAEATAFPDNVVVAWPRGDDTILEFIEGIHQAVALDESDLIEWRERDVVRLEDVGLTYPLTVEDLVDNWEQVNALWDRLTAQERSSIRRVFDDRSRWS